MNTINNVVEPFNFDSSTNNWFDDDFPNEPIAHVLYEQTANLYPNRNNLLKVQATINQLPNPLKDKILHTINGILNHKCKDFRYHFHRYPMPRYASSACGSLFNLLSLFNLITQATKPVPK